MNFQFSEEAEALRDQARRFLEERSGREKARAVAAPMPDAPPVIITTLSRRDIVEKGQLPQDAARSERFEADKLNQLVGK